MPVLALRRLGLELCALYFLQLEIVSDNVLTFCR
jgi:hypothetical protein